MCFQVLPGHMPNGHSTIRLFDYSTSMGNIDQGATNFFKSLKKRPFQGKQVDGFDLRSTCKMDCGTFAKVLGISQQDDGGTHRKGVHAAAQRPEARPVQTRQEG